MVLQAELVHYRRECWVTPAGKTVLAPLPAGIVGGYGPNLRRFCLMLHAQGQVTTERLTTLVNDVGVEISKRQVVRLLTKRLDGSVEEDAAVLHAGLVSAPYVTVDDTGARHAHGNGYTTQIGGEHFTAFRTTSTKSRLNFLSLLRGSYQDYVLNDAAFDYPERRKADPALVVRLLEEADIWGSIRHHGLLGNAVIVSDDAGQFRVGNHALCWVHAERLLHKLMPATPEQARQVKMMRDLIWRYYKALKAYRQQPSPSSPDAFRQRFDRIFAMRTGYHELDRLLMRLQRRKGELLKVLEHPHTNASENDLRTFVTKRKISGGADGAGHDTGLAAAARGPARRQSPCH